LSAPEPAADGGATARRFGGMDRLYGPAAASRIRGATVAVVGIGGVGSWAAEALARSGIGGLVLVDLDHVSESNINRQIHALGSTVGQAKVLAMQQRIADIHPGCTVHAVDDFAEPGNWPALLPVAVDAVIDACDDARAKEALAAWALASRTPFVTVGAAGGKRLAQQVEIADLALATHDPLLAKLRYQLRRVHGAPRDGKPLGVACVFSREPVSPPDASCAVAGDGSLNCAGYGSSVTVTATFGLCAAGWAMERLVRGL
jgi:tRNA A37 threonylcarbamoyladenosine dehydratase